MAEILKDVFEDDKGNQHYLANNTETTYDQAGVPLNNGGDLSEASVNFSVSTTRKSLTAKARFKALMGDIAKWLADLGTAAFCNVANNDTTTMPGFVAGAQIVKTHGDEIDKLYQDLGALNSKGNAELLVNGTTTGIKTVPNLSQYRFLACYMVGNIGYMADLIIPVSLFKTLDNSVTSKRIRVIHGTEYYYDACYVTDTSINILAINNAPYYIYGIK